MFRLHLLALLGLSPALSLSSPHTARSDVTAACKQIAGALSSSSAVLYSGTTFTNDLHHWYGTSTQTPACVVELASPQDAAIAMKVIGQTRTPFAIKSGGHTSNPGFSSTTGIHLSLTRMQDVRLSSDNSTVEIQTGITWSDVYEKLDGTGYNTVGGRTQGPGVGGFSLGGGYSWKTQQYGLTCDVVKAFNVVLPNATIARIDASHADLFFALKGGLNRFGLVTSIEFYTHKQTQVYGGIGVYGSGQVPALVNATRAFQATNKDPRTQIITTLNGGVLGTTALVLFFHDAPTKPDTFKLWDNIPPIIKSVKEQSFSSFVSTFAAGLVSNSRGTFNTLSTTSLTPGFLKAVKSEVDRLGKQMLTHSGTFVSYDVEPFLAYGKHATDGAYPHSDSPLPLNLYFAWTNAADDKFWYNALHSSVETLKQAAIKDGIYPKTGFIPSYPNYAISNTTAEAMYGTVNAKRLKKIRAAVDKDNVMGLAGGFSI